MKESRMLMGMPITVEIVGQGDAVKDAVNKAFEYFQYVDDKFSVFKPNSEITKINQGKIKENERSDDIKLIFALSEQTKKETNGYFDIVSRGGRLNPSGIVKGWAIWEVAKLIKGLGFENFFVDAGGDIQVFGKNSEGEFWRIGIKNPFDQKNIVKAVRLENEGIATSGTYIRGQHIYDPFDKNKVISDIVGLSVIGPNVYEADRFATAAFAMGKSGLAFIASRGNLEGYMIDKDGIATMTEGFNKYVIK
ncbi:MAG: FAD:protein FMN transferase [Candidatus Taylorbacteria bacterium]|nr:FAD:protein FMN transferase [Candidatus Taylorbacteria bacterium]